MGVEANHSYTDNRTNNFIHSTLQNGVYTDGKADAHFKRTADGGYTDGNMDQVLKNVYGPNGTITIKNIPDAPHEIPAKKDGVSDDQRFAKLDSYVKDQRNRLNTSEEDIEAKVAKSMGLKSAKDLPPDVRKRIQDDCSGPAVVPHMEIGTAQNPDQTKFMATVDSDHRYDALRDWVKNIQSASPNGNADPELLIKVAQGNRPLSTEERYVIYRACGKEEQFFSKDKDGMKM